MSQPSSEPTTPIGLTPPPLAPPEKHRRRLPVWAWIVIAVVAFGVGLLLSPIFAVIFLVVLVTGIVALVKNTSTWLRFSSRRVATWVTAVAAVGFLLTGALANVVLSGAPKVEAVAAAGPSAESPHSARPTLTPTSVPTPEEEAVTLISVTDGDTIDTTAGTVRLIGMDTPEVGQWGYEQSTSELTAFLAGGSLSLVAVDGRDDTDRYGRLLRYVTVNGVDAGAHMIETGWAIARYDSRDGYGGHPLESDYLTLDARHDMPAEPAPQPTPSPAAPTTPAEPAKPSKPAAPAAPANDPQFRTCGEANDAGYGDYQQGVDPEYAWYQDRDHDGWVCER